MDNLALLWPIVAQASLTVLVLLLIPILRVSALFKGKAHITDYLFGDTENVPEMARLANRNYMNLLQIPILFYVVCLLFMITGVQSDLVVNTAWAYVGLRLLHSLIHIGYNNVNHRFFAFLLSNIALLVLWIELLRNLN